MSLATITPTDLPPQAYAHTADHDITLTADPAHWRPIRDIGTGWVKPKGGTGLWTSPVTARTPDGAPADSAWLEWCRAEMDTDTADQYLTEIAPAPTARLLLIDSQAHLAAIIDRYPAAQNPHIHRAGYPDWPAMAADWDGVYLTDQGQWATRLPDTGPDLYGWDMESCLWLRPAYTVGRTARATARSEAGAA